MRFRFSTILLVAAAASLTACAGGGRPGTATKYRPANLFGGYSDKVVEPGVWRVEGRANGIAESGFAQNMAVYRAADLVKQAGFEYMQIIDQKGKQSFVGIRGGSMSSAGENMILWVKGSHDGSQPSECRAKTPDLCFTLPVAETMAKIFPRLTFPSDGT